MKAIQEVFSKGDVLESKCTYGTNPYRHLWTNEDSISWKSKVLGFSKCEWEKKRENMKSEGANLEGK